MRTDTQRPRRKWPWILGTTVAVVALVIGASVWYGSRPNNSLPGSAPSSAPTLATGVATASADAAPTGCLGGQGRDAAMIAAAQKAATNSTSGGVEVATAFTRLLLEYPYPSAVDIAAITATGIATDAPTKDLASFYATNPNLSGGLVDDGTKYHLSTVGGVWHVESSSATVVVASIGTALVINNQMSPTLKGSVTVTVEWQDGAWKFKQSAGTRTPQDLFGIGTQFTSGC